MVPTRRGRNSIPGHTPTPGDEVSHLTLNEVRDRLTRNARVLASNIMSPSTSPSATSVLNQNMAGPSRPPAPSPRHDPVRSKLEAMREALLAREAELLALEMEGVSVKDEPVELGSSPLSPMLADRRESAGKGGVNSGKQRALKTIKKGEAALGPGAIILPIDQTLSLGNRDFTTQTLDTFSHLSLVKPPKKQYDPLDENARAQALARMNDFMSYKGDGDFDAEEDDGDAGDMFGFDDDGDVGYGDEDAGGGRGNRGTGENVDRYGEDEEMWREGAEDEYTLRGGNLGES